MASKIRRWVFITALLLAVTWRPSANHQILLHFVVCAGAIMVILALSLYQTENRDSLRRQQASHFRL
jgi:hypothetical protein